jgi:hypothetical protein
MTRTLWPETVAEAPCSTREQELLEDGSKLGTPQKGGGAQSWGMEAWALTNEQRSKLEKHLAEEHEALEEQTPEGGRVGQNAMKRKGQCPEAHEGPRTRKRMRTIDDRGAVAKTID